MSYPYSRYYRDYNGDTREVNYSLWLNEIPVSPNPERVYEICSMNEDELMSRYSSVLLVNHSFGDIVIDVPLGTYESVYYGPQK